MSLYPLSNTWDTKYVTVSYTWAIKDTVTLYLTKYTLCSGMGVLIPQCNEFTVKKDQFCMYIINIFDMLTILWQGFALERGTFWSIRALKHQK